MNTFWLGKGISTFGLGKPYATLLAGWKNIVTFDVFIAKRVVRKVNIAKLKQLEVLI